MRTLILLAVVVAGVLVVNASLQTEQQAPPPALESDPWPAPATGEDPWPAPASGGSNSNSGEGGSNSNSGSGGSNSNSGEGGSNSNSGSGGSNSNSGSGGSNSNSGEGGSNSNSGSGGSNSNSGSGGSNSNSGSGGSNSNSGEGGSNSNSGSGGSNSNSGSGGSNSNSGEGGSNSNSGSGGSNSNSGSGGSNSNSGEGDSAPAPAPAPAPAGAEFVECAGAPAPIYISPISPPCGVSFTLYTNADEFNIIFCPNRDPTSQDCYTLVLSTSGPSYFNQGGSQICNYDPPFLTRNVHEPLEVIINYQRCAVENRRNGAVLEFQDPNEADFRHVYGSCIGGSTCLIHCVRQD